MEHRVEAALKASRYDIAQPRVREIIDALFELGGSAHCMRACEIVARRRGLPRPSDDLRGELHAAFQQGLQGSERRASALRLPFGPGSHRWALESGVFSIIHGVTQHGWDLEPPYRPPVAPRHASPAPAASGISAP
jgi:hypothetical protein